VEKIEAIPMSAGELIGKANEWRVVARKRGASSIRDTIVYQRGEAVRPEFEITESNWVGVDDFLVQVCNRSGEVWRRFKDKRKMEDFLSDISNMIFYKGLFFKTRKSANFYSPFNTGFWGTGRPKMPREKRDKIIDCMTNKRMGIERTADEIGICVLTVARIMKEEGYVFIGNKSYLSRDFGKWEKATIQ
jgi:hypothetical protein